ncbi:MAG: ComF family protein [Candidatus Zixiibacteriota bacterium]
MMTRIASELNRGLLDLFYPPVCGACGGQADSADRLICDSCWETITGFSDPYCLTCKNFLSPGVKCTICRGGSVPVFSLGYYEDKLESVIYDLKFAGLKPLAVPIGRKLADMIDRCGYRDRIDFIVPIPIHHSRLQMRGFNQADEIAKSIGNELRISVLSETLRVRRKKRQQARLNAAERERNMHDALGPGRSQNSLKGASILIVDDVTTTGATILEARRVLKKELGAKKIFAAVAATAL